MSSRAAAIFPDIWGVDVENGRGTVVSIAAHHGRGWQWKKRVEQNDC